MSDFAHKHIFLLNSTMKFFLKTDIICVNQFGTGCLKKVLDNQARFRAIGGFDTMLVRFWYFARRNVPSWRELALHFSVRLAQELQ